MDETEVVFVDANIFLEYVLDDQKADNCEVFIKKIKNREITAATSDFIIYSCLIQIQNKLRSIVSMQNFLFLINDLRKGLKILRPTLKVIYDASKLMTNYKLDFDDALVVSCMINNNIKKLISLDKDFDKVNAIRRLEP